MDKEFTPQGPVTLPHPNKLLVIEPLDYPNPYNFRKPHRHNYFEIILVKAGKGHQYIDFKPYDMESGQLYNVYPGQVHLMRRDTAEGLLIQFRKDLFRFIQPLQHYHLYFSKPVFNPNPETFAHLYSLTVQIADLLSQKNLSQLAIYKAYSYLQIILISLSEMQDEKIMLGNYHLVSQFLSLLPEKTHSRKKVADYCEIINCSYDKLNNACKTALGKTALELIHEELLLEIQRLFLISPLSLKEIAYELNFDSPANFSNFIKTHTNLTPTALQSSILDIYK